MYLSLVSGVILVQAEITVLFSLFPFQNEPSTETETIFYSVLNYRAFKIIIYNFIPTVQKIASQFTHGVLNMYLFSRSDTSKGGVCRKGSCCFFVNAVSFSSLMSWGGVGPIIRIGYLKGVVVISLKSSPSVWKVLSLGSCLYFSGLIGAC